jgi:hypothetical protein
MYSHFNPTFISTDPIEIQRIEARRPATQMEIVQRGQREARLRWLTIADQEAKAESRERSILKFLPNALSGISRSVRRALGNGGERIGQQAA